ncbi:MAG TPA: DUF6518 family protein [Propionicimonas sp.]
MSAPVVMDRRPRATWLWVGGVAVASFLLGLLTFYAQGNLADAWLSFANSASGWTLLTALLVFFAQVSTRVAAALGALSFLLLVLGYTAGAQLNGLSYSPVLFGVVGVIAGPFIGLAAAWLRARRVRAALATALLAGIFTGEAVYGLTVIADSTRPEYWLAIGAVGIALLIGMVGMRVRGWLPVTIAVLGTAAVAGAFLAAYSALGQG